MLTEEFSLDFVGFQPSEAIISRIRIAMSDVYSLSPHGSFMKATFTKTGEAFEGIVNVANSVAKFAVEATHPDLEKLSSLAFDKIKAEIDSWKTTRFV